jgi:hypothetical protein
MKCLLCDDCVECDREALKGFEPQLQQRPGFNPSPSIASSPSPNMLQRPQQQPPYTPMRQGPINPPATAKRPTDSRPPPPQQKR